MAILTIRHYNDLVQTFIDNVTKREKSYYMFVGKPEPWDIDNAPPSANGSVAQYQLNAYQNIVYGKLLTSADVAALIPRYDWTTGTHYDRYDQNDGDLYTKKFFVVTNKNEVYKCSYNNAGGASTVKPDLATVSGTFRTADGYVWKYMYTIESVANTAFTSNNYIPITANTEVAANAVGGTIDTIAVEAGGINYQTYHEGFLTAFVNNYVIQLESTASPLNNFYTGSSIYLKAGYGAGQIRDVRSYSGLSKQVITVDPLDTFAHFELTNINGGGSIVAGLTAMQQIDSLAIDYAKGYFNPGDSIVQSDSGAAASVVTSNSSILTAVRTSANQFSLALPIYNASQSGTLKSGNVSITANSLLVTAVAGTSFVAEYPANSYIRVGTNANNNIRRVVSANSSALVCDAVFTANLVANIHYSLPYAADITSITLFNANGIVTDVNLDGVSLAISNSSILGTSFFLGEQVNMVDVNNINQLANGIVSFANTTSVVLDNVEGTFTSGYFLLGSSSLQKSGIDYVAANPNVTVKDPSKAFVAGQTVFFRQTANLNVSVANATISSSYITPNELTEYVISPKVTITGDGDGALAYATVNAVANAIQTVVMINPGEGYNFATVAISANSLFGNSALAAAIIAPNLGHGSSPVEELGSVYLGISKTFSGMGDESYHVPGYGKYRVLGILENPLFVDATVNLDTFDHAKLVIRNKNGNNFANGEIVIQPQSNAAAIVNSYDPGANATFLELKMVRGTFISNTSNDHVYGLQSDAQANIAIFNTTRFTLHSNVEIVSELFSGASADIDDVISNTQIHMTNVSGIFAANDTLYDATTNAYANVVSIYTANGGIDVTSSFGSVFDQTARITLTSTHGTFTPFEMVVQDTTLATGRVISTTDEVDLVYASANSSFIVGDVMTSTNTAASATVIYANTTYLKTTSATGKFYPGDTVINTRSGGAIVSNAYPVLVIDDVSGPNRFQVGSNVITGSTSGAYGVPFAANTITYPDLVRNSGSVIYIENIAPFERSNTSQEKIGLVIKF